MSDWAIHELTNEISHKLLYIYDFFSMWTFYIELLDIVDIDATVDYPRMVASVGLMPEDAPDKEFIGEDAPTKELDNFDVFEGDDSFDQAGYDEFNDNWN